MPIEEQALRSKHERLYDAALDAIKELFHDHTVDERQTAQELYKLIDEIKDMLKAVE